MDGQTIFYVVGGVTIASQVGSWVVLLVKSYTSTKLMTKAFEDYKKYNDDRYKTFKNDWGLLCAAKHEGVDARIDRIEDIQNGKGK